MHQYLSRSFVRLKRRDWLRQNLLLALATGIPMTSHANSPRVLEYTLTPAPTTLPLIGTGYPDTAVWAFNKRIPGPEIRLRQGDHLRVTVDNALAQEPTVHWHGIRLPNAMDGVPHLTQAPIAPGERFVYEFQPPDAGTYWYHPHVRSFEQVGRGLYGSLIVEEPEPIVVDRDITWVLDDWRLTQDGSIREDFGNGHDMSHAGRLGNSVSVNGRIIQNTPVRSGERIRLRLINAANARSFALSFAPLEPKVIALDGQPVAPYSASRIVLGSRPRADLVLDLTGSPGSKVEVTDSFFRQSFLVTTLNYSDLPPIREQLLDSPIALPANPLPEPNLERAKRFEVRFSGGAMGGLNGALLDGQWTDIRTLARSGLVWAINGVVANKTMMEPMLSVATGEHVLLMLHNDTAFPHPIHLHGHHFRVLKRNGEPVPQQPWRDSLLLQRQETAEALFVADNPGDWLFHCHILEHHAGGMGAVIRVT